MCLTRCCGSLAFTSTPQKVTHSYSFMLLMTGTKGSPVVPGSYKNVNCVLGLQLCFLTRLITSLCLKVLSFKTFFSFGLSFWPQL